MPENKKLKTKILRYGRLFSMMALSSILVSCSDFNVPMVKDVDIPPPVSADKREKAVNEKPDSVMYLPLGEDVLVPEVKIQTNLPDDIVGPYELRGETLAGALQLVLDDYNYPIAFESSKGLSRTITVVNLKGRVSDVVTRMCGLADLYCSTEDGMLVVKDTQTFTVTIPPIGETTTLLSEISGAIEAITGNAPVVDEGTRTIIYEASHRTSEIAKKYFQKLRSGTAMVVFETYIWEVSLDSGNSTGINWSQMADLGNFNTGISVSGVVDPSLGAPISIGLPTKGQVDLSAGDVFKFISDYGAVKTISQPQITMLSGSSSRLRVADTQNYVSSITRSMEQGIESVSTTTDSVDTGFTLEIEGFWDNSTVYGNINILLQEVRGIETFDDNPDAIVQLPQTTEREVETHIRIRPGDSLLLAGLVREINNFDKSGLGFHSPFIPTSRSSGTSNVELVFLMRPKVIVYTQPNNIKVPNKVDYVVPKHEQKAKISEMPRPRSKKEEKEIKEDVVAKKEEVYVEKAEVVKVKERLDKPQELLKENINNNKDEQAVSKETIDVEELYPQGTISPDLLNPDM